MPELPIKKREENLPAKKKYDKKPPSKIVKRQLPTKVRLKRTTELQKQVRKLRKMKIPPPLIVPRSSWTKEPYPLAEGRMVHPCGGVLVTHTMMNTCRGVDPCLPLVLQLHDKHVEMGLGDIAYNFLVSTDGTLFEGRGWNIRPRRLGTECEDNPSDVILVGLIGTYGDDGGKYQYPGVEMLGGLEDLFGYAVEKGYLVEEGYLEKDLTPPEGPRPEAEFNWRCFNLITRFMV